MVVLILLYIGVKILMMFAPDVCFHILVKFKVTE